MSLLRTLLERYQHHRLRRHGTRARVDPSSRLLRRFAVSFLAPPEERLYVSIGARCLLNCALVFESRQGRIEIGDRTYIGTGTTIISREHVSIGSDVTMAWNITIYDHNSHALDWRRRQRVVDHFYRTYGQADCFAAIDWSGVAAAPIVIEDRAWIGFGATILKGVRIGEGAVVGARSVVVSDVAPYTVVAGNPAVPIKKLTPTSHEGNRDDSK